MFSLFNKAVTTGDKVTAQKWLAIMNTIAPESPQAIQARAVFKDISPKPAQ
jgi:hypothetical protein